MSPFDRDPMTSIDVLQ